MQLHIHHSHYFHTVSGHLQTLLKFCTNLINPLSFPQQKHFTLLSLQLCYSLAHSPLLSTESSSIQRLWSGRYEVRAAELIYFLGWLRHLVRIPRANDLALPFSVQSTTRELQALHTWSKYFRNILKYLDRGDPTFWGSKYFVTDLLFYLNNYRKFSLSNHLKNPTMVMQCASW